MERLKKILSRIDGKGYGAYKEIYGTYNFFDYLLEIKKVQPDPFAPPSRIIVKIPLEKAGFPRYTFNSFTKKIALYDYLHRAFFKINKTKEILLPRPIQQILFRSIFHFNKEEIKFKFKLQLPAVGRKILGKRAYEIFFEEIPKIVKKILFYKNLSPKEIEEHIRLIEDQEYIRERLKEKGLVAFIANGSILPRESGISNKPMKNAIKFTSPGSLKIKFVLPSGREVEGAGIKEGITIICGGGFHGKSTLLEALQYGVYNHTKGDGREFVITREDAVKIRAEDGRYIEKVDISAFVENLPFGKTTEKFSTEDASGSTSQAANIIEALEAGSRCLLIDEDTSATNLMIRDLRMQELVSKEKEPLIPFIDRIRELWERFRVSVIMVTGGVGDYFEVADCVIVMNEYIPEDRTLDAKRIIEKFSSKRRREINKPFKMPEERFVLSSSINPYRGNKIRISAKGKDTLVFGRESIDLSGVEQIVESLQVQTAGEIIWYGIKNYSNLSIREMVEKAISDTLKNEFENLSHPWSCDYCFVRKYEVISVINRLRSLKVK